MAAKPEVAKGWTNLLIGSGMAAALTTIGAYAVEFAREGQDSCTIAASFLQDDTFSPYLGDRTRRRLVGAAAARFERCVKD